MKKLFIVVIMVINFLLIGICENRVLGFSSSIDKDELEQLNIILEEKLNQEKYDYELIDSFDQKNAYILVEGEKSYLIYDRQLKDYTEYSTLDNSQFYNLDKRYIKIYYTVGNYFYSDGLNVFSVESGISLTTSEHNLLKDENKKTKEKWNRNKDEIVKKHSNVSRTSSSNEGSVSNSYYFERLILNMGDNVSGSCTYVAIGMILSYYDAFLNDNIISEAFDATVNQTFSSVEQIELSQYTQSPGILETFHQFLINEGRENGYTSENEFGISMNEMVEYLEDYLLSRGINSAGSYDASLDVSEFCREAIRNDFPVIIQIVDNLFMSFNHAVVGYKFDSTGIYVNYGWRDNRTSVNINNFMALSAVYINIDDNHVHSNNYTWLISLNTGYKCGCGIVVCNHEDKEVTTYNSSQHKYICKACSAVSYAGHNFINNVCTLCNYYIECDHQYLYDNYYTSTVHRLRCSICSKSITESHDMYQYLGKNYCEVCPYEGNSFSGGILKIINKATD